MKWLNILLGIVIIFMGTLPFLGGILPEGLKIIPSSGNGYSLIILIIGVLIVVNTYSERRHMLGLK